MTDLKAMLPHERLSFVRSKAGYANATDAARAFGWNENTYRSHENGERGLRFKVAERYARAFGVPPELLIVGGSRQGTTDRIPLLGKVDAYWNVNFISDIDTVKSPLTARLPVLVGTEFGAVEIEKTAYLTTFRPFDLIVFWLDETYRFIEDNFAIVLPEGREPVLRYVQKGTIKGRYDLSLPTGQSERNVVLEAAKAMHLMMPGSQWFKRDTRTDQELPKG